MRQDLIFSVSTVILSAFFLFVSIRNPARSSTFIGPNDWPNMVLTFTLILGIYYLVKTIRQLANVNVKKEDVVKRNNEESGDFFYKNKQWVILCALALYTLLLPYTGYIVTTIVLTGFLFWLLGMKNKGAIILLSLASNVFFIVLFAIILKITLPRGIGMFETLSFIFY